MGVKIARTQTYLGLNYLAFGTQMPIWDVGIEDSGFTCCYATVSAPRYGLLVYPPVCTQCVSLGSTIVVSVPLPGSFSETLCS